MIAPSEPRLPSALRQDFDAFLFAKIDDVVSDLSLRMVSVLARLDLDPWLEAAELTQMPKDTAVQRLTALLTNLPDGPIDTTSSQAVASRLVDLLPAQATQAVRWSSPSDGQSPLSAVSLALFVLLSMLIMMIVSTELRLADEPAPRPIKATVASPLVTAASERR